MPKENLTPAFAVEAPATANPITATAKMIFFIFTFRYFPAFSALSF
jgi:hypothetical protein